MKINNHIFNNPLDLDSNILGKGAIFKAEILEIYSDEVALEIKGLGIIKAEIDTEISMNLNDEMTFLVKSSNEKKIEIKPILIDNFENIETKETNSQLSSKLFPNKNIRIKDSKLFSQLTKSLMENNIQLSEENLTNSIKILDKLIELFDLTEDEKIIFLEGKDSKDTNLNNKYQIKESPIEEKPKGKNINHKIVDNVNSDKSEEASPHKAHIKHLLVTDKSNYNEKKDLRLIVEEFLFKEGDFKVEELPKIIGFIIKNNIKPSLNNIKNIEKLSNNPDVFLKEFLEIKKDFKEFAKDNLVKRDFISEEKFIKEDLIKDKILEIDKFHELEKTLTEIKSLKNYNSNEKVNLFNDKIDFLKELNKNLSFIFMPIDYQRSSLEGVLSFIKRKNKKTKDGKTNVFISLDTKVLGKIKISCNLYKNNINVKINIDKEDLKLFKSREEDLIKRVSAIGYELKKIDYLYEEDLKVIDEMVVNDNPTYYLDMKV